MHKQRRLPLLLDRRLTSLLELHQDVHWIDRCLHNAKGFTQRVNPSSSCFYGRRNRTCGKICTFYSNVNLLTHIRHFFLYLSICREVEENIMYEFTFYAVIFDWCKGCKIQQISFRLKKDETIFVLLKNAWIFFHCFYSLEQYCDI